MAVPGLVRVPDPRQAFFGLVRTWIELETHADTPPAIHPDASVADTAIISNGAAIGAGAHIGPYTFIGPGVQIGKRTSIQSHVSVRFSLIGDDVKILAGARLGEDGFGLIAGEGHMDDLPHYGRVILQDGVTFGANSSIDRGLLGDTMIGEHSKIDNQCHIGHNTVVGRNVAMAAYAGISGSVKIGDNALLGGRVGIADHVEVGAGAQLAADTALLRDVPPGETWAGSPAQPIKDHQRQVIWLRRTVGQKGERGAPS